MSGVPSQFEEAYLRFGPLLRKIAAKKFGIPVQDVEPLVHDVFATYFLRWTTVEAPERYLVGAICNASRKYWEQADAAGLIFCGETPCAATPSDALLREVHSKVLLSRILGCVGAKCRDLLEGYYMNGETTRAIADRLRSSPATVLVLLHRCRKRALAAYQSMTERS
ncbi:MAG TPA: sigma-70 family RNA polymerase sigma factor [Thermoanaerobaculia bacterium]|nr:sigma-70 family RNA polymerase sigma factor [Thermoanaerobaculia bacterium]